MLLEIPQYVISKYTFNSVGAKMSSGLFFPTLPTTNQCPNGILMNITLNVLASTVLHCGYLHQLELTADGGILYKIAYAGFNYTNQYHLYTITPAQLAAQGIVLTVGNNYQFASYVASLNTNNGYASIILNDVDLLSNSANYTLTTSATNSLGFNGGSGLVGATGGPTAAVVKSNFTLHALIYFGGNNGANVALAGNFRAWCAAIWNQGRGMNFKELRKTGGTQPSLNGLINTIYVFDKTNFIGGKYVPTYNNNPAGTNLMGIFLPGIPHNQWDNLLIRRVGNRMLDANPSGPILSTSLKDYVYEADVALGRPGSQYYLKGGFTGVFSQFNGSTDIPSHLTGVFDISFNKWGGLTAGVNTNTVITNCKTTSFIANNQTPLGTDSCTIYYAIPTATLLALQATKKTSVNITTQAGTAQTVITTVNLNNNSLNQTPASLMDYTKIKPVNLNCSFNTNLKGEIPRPPDEMTGTLNYNSTGVTVLPTDFNRVTNLNLDGTPTTGVIVANYATAIQFLNRTAVASANLSGQLTNVSFVGNGLPGLSAITLQSTVGRTFTDFYVEMNSAASLIPFNSVTWTLIPRTTRFVIFGNNSQNQVYPIGTVICANTIQLLHCGLNQANTDATVDNYLTAMSPTGVSNAVAAGYQGMDASVATLKTFTISRVANNQQITPSGTRMDSLAQMAETYNVAVIMPNAASNDTYFHRILSITPTTTLTGTHITVTLRSGTTNGAPSKISNTASWDGIIGTTSSSYWQLVSRNTSESAALTTININNTGNVFILTRGTTNTQPLSFGSETGILTTNT